MIDIYTEDQIRRVLNGIGVDVESYIVHIIITAELQQEKFQKSMVDFSVLDVKLQKV